MGTELPLRDAQGRTLEEFLAEYHPGDYPHPSLTADIAVFAQGENGLRVLLIRRGGHPCLGCWALPGGFANPDECVEETAARELEEETCLTGLEMAPICFFTRPGRDPRTWIVSRTFVALIPPERMGEIRASDDAADARWFDVKIEKDGEDAVLTLTGGDTVLKLELTVKRVPVAFALDRIDVHEKQKCGMAFDHSEMLGIALARMGLL